jgi:hypothetical protein
LGGSFGGVLTHLFAAAALPLPDGADRSVTLCSAARRNGKIIVRRSIDLTNKIPDWPSLRTKFA